MYLLDTVTVSQSLSRRADAKAFAWIAKQKASDLFISVVTVAEIRRGAVQVRKKDAAFANRIDSWLDTTVTAFADRIVPIGVSIARVWGGLQASVGHGGEDIMIAATALDRDFTVVTRNASDFARLGVKVENPFF
ncbi:MAG: type II toxin-antitoxin system VapC family toxin [Alphaproteobacteria bacterium]|nr:type II toxin-antitoxin system VapC family toxin [Alphaproteobacteria bacterium]